MASNFLIAFPVKGGVGFPALPGNIRTCPAKSEGSAVEQYKTRESFFSLILISVRPVPSVANIFLKRTGG
jgi:hypothetical protein